MATLIEIETARLRLRFGFETLQLPEIVSFTTLRNKRLRQDLDGRRAVGRAYLATFAGVLEAAACEGGEHLAKRVGMAGDQQAPAGLRVGQQRQIDLGKSSRQLHLAGVASPVAG